MRHIETATDDRALLRLLCGRHCVGRFLRPYAGEWRPPSHLQRRRPWVIYCAPFTL